MSIVKMARAIYERRNGFGCVPWGRIHADHKRPYIGDASAALTATGLTEAQLEGLANGTHYIIERPRFDEGPRHMSDDFRFGEPSNDEVRRAMLAAKEG